MARHRDVRNIDADEFAESEDYGSSYGSSFCDEIPLSRSMEREYMYRRNASGTTPKMTDFLARTNSVGSVPEENEDEAINDSDDSSSSGGMGRRHSSGSSLVEGLNAEESAKLASCLEYVLDIVGDTIPDVQVKEAIIKCDFDGSLAVNTLLNNPIGLKSSYSKSSDRSKTKPRGTRSSPPPFTTIEPLVSQTASEAKSEFLTPSSSNASKLSIVDSPMPEEVFATPGPLENVKRGKRLDIRSRSPSPAMSTPSAAASTVRMRKNKVDVLEEYKRVHSATQKQLLNLVVVGHVDSGKSTLMGHLLYELGNVSRKAMHKFEVESKKLGKQSFAYAWVLDETTEERARGITMDVGQNWFETKTKGVRLLDAPGHRDFIPNMISGAYQADVAILVVNATRGEFEAGFDAGGQTREHAVLVRSLGVSQLIVAVNKLDTVDWSQSRFLEIVEKLKQFLKASVGFRDSDVTYVPVSGLTGDNLVKESDIDWYDGCTLLEAIDKLRAPPRLIEKPFRMAASDVYKPAVTSGLAVAGRIESGFVMVNDKVLVQPLNELATVKSIENSEGVVNMNMIAFAGEHVGLILSNIDAATSVNAGMIVVDPTMPLPVTRHFGAKIVVFTVDVPITKGFSCVLHHGSVQTAANVKKLVGLLDRSTGDVSKTQKRPRLLTKGANAVVEITTDSPVCIDLYSNVKELGRFMLRTGGKTIAAGMVTATY